MARASVETLLPLDSWAKIIGISQFEFNQAGEGFPNGNYKQCEHVWFQYVWQQDFLSREELAQQIAQAEYDIAIECGYWPAPKYLVDEPQGYPRPYRRDIYGHGVNVRGQVKSVKLDWAEIQGPGILARSSVAAAAAVVLTDTDLDTIMDTFTVTVPTTVTNSAEIGVYFQATDRLGAAIDETWRIRPVSVTLTGGNAVIVGSAWSLVKPILNNGLNTQSLNVTDTTNLVTKLDVYRVYTDSTATPAVYTNGVITTPAVTNQGVAIWEQPCDSPPCSVALYPVCLGDRMGKQGTVSVDYTLNGSIAPFADGLWWSGREPDRIKVNYLAGVPLVNGDMDHRFALAVAYLATGRLPAGKIGCERSERIIDWYRQYPNQGENQRPITVKEIDECPWGQSRGALDAWHRIQYLRQRSPV